MARQSTRAPKVGLLLSVAEGAAGGRWNELKAMARHAEAAGFDSVWIADHLVIPNNVQAEPALGRWECWTILAALAAVTSRIELGTLVTCTNFRNPALLAKMADTVEEISDGRLILGLGAGYYEPEFRAFGFPFDHRIGRFEEALRIIHRLLRSGSIDFEGQYYQARNCELRPRGPRPTGPPILIGAQADRLRALRLTAQYADYWNMFIGTGDEDFTAVHKAVDEACVKAGRDPATLHMTASAMIDLPGSEKSPVAVRAYRSSRALPAGTPEELGERLRALAAAGIGHVQLWLEPNTRAGIDAFLPVLDLLERE
jgi:probable F420-dependent oxidoreductase